MSHIDPDKLEQDAGVRGLSLSGLAAEAGITRNTMAKIRRGESVRPQIHRQLDEALSRIPVLEHVQTLEQPA